MVQSQTKKKNALHDLGYKIFLDRYALKDMKRETLAVGDLVIVVVNSATGQREVGRITAMQLPQVTIELLDGEVVTRDIEHVDKPLETDPAQMMDRVAAGIAAVEKTTKKRREWANNFRWLLEDWKFVPGGRILTAAGTDQELTFYNCMPPEQEILTADGYKPIADVRVGELVVTHKNRLRPVLHKFERETEEDIYTITPKKIGYDVLRVTGEHKIHVIRSEWVNPDRRKKGLQLSQEPAWIPANQLKKGDFVAVAYDGEICPPAVIRVSDYLPQYSVQDGKLFKPTTRGGHGYVSDWGTHFSINNDLELDADLCFLFGRWLGDGCVTHRTKTDIPSGIKIVFALDERQDAERIADIIRQKLGIEPALKTSSTGRWLDLWVNSMTVGEFFKAFFGAYSHSKRIPTELMHMEDVETRALLHGLFSSDGYISKDNIGILLANQKLCVQIHQLLLRLGYFFTIFENTHKNGRVASYRLTAPATEAQDLFQQFFNHIPELPATSLRAYIDYDGLRWVRIESITTENYRGMVMDIEVEEDHSFVSAGLVVSNCYVIPLVGDSRGGIIETLGNMTEIMSRGGGVGINLSTLRPRHAYVKGVNGRSSGSVSWGALYSFVTGLIEQGGCFGPDERIATDKGLIPAKELADRMDAGETFYAHTHKGLRKITARFRNGIKPLYDVTTSRGYNVKITQDHKVAVLADGKITTTALKYLQEGDEILLQLGDGIQQEYYSLKPVEYERSIMSTKLNEDVCIPEYLNEDLAYLIGYMHGDGYIQWGKKVNWSAPKAFKLSTADAHPTIRQRLIDVIQSQFGVTPLVRQGDGALAEVYVYSRLIIEWMIQNGLLKAKAESIRVPEAIFRSPSSVMNAFIAGYFDADGCNRGRKGGYGIDSISYEMLTDVQKLLALNGIVSSIGTTDRSKQRWQTIHRLSVTGGVFKKRFSEIIPSEKATDVNGSREMYNTYPATVWTALGARSKYRQRIYDGVSERISYGQMTAIAERIANDGLEETAQEIEELLHTLPDTISSITYIGESDVYDFEVDDVHLICANGVYTSNSRRGALMLILNDWHPDIFDFVNSKREAGKITNANISVGLSDRFMDAMKADADWHLQFPDTSHPDYDTLWDGDLEKWIEAGREVITYKTIKAKELWNAIIESAWASAEPGVWFRERSNKMSNSWYFNPLIATNPCGEQPLSAYSVCNLGAINLAIFYDEENHDVAWDDLERTVSYATRFLDNVIDTTPYFFEENRKVQLAERRVGLGTMGVAELMIKLHIRYGSDESVEFIDKLYKFMAVHAYKTSSAIAKEKGSFPQFDPEKFLQSGFMQQMPDDVKNEIVTNGIRNVTLLTQAPTGTTGTMVNTSTGIEPFFSWVYYRKSRLGLHEEQVPIVQDWYAENPQADKLPDYFITAMDLAPMEHVKVQGAFQRWIDSAISKTANLPNNYTIQQTAELYEYMYSLGCKGGTIYRDGSRDEQVLMLKGDERAEKENDAKSKKEDKVEQVATPHRVYPRPKRLHGVTVNTQTPFGTAYITMNSDEQGYPFEVFITAPGKAGSDLQADAEGLGRMISLSLRTTEPHNRREMLRLIIDQLRDIGGARSIGFGMERVISLPDAVARALEDNYFPKSETLQLQIPMMDVSVGKPVADKKSSNGNGHDHHHEVEVNYSTADLCPSCGTISLVRAEGCRRCLTCDYTEC